MQHGEKVLEIARVEGDTVFRRRILLGIVHDVDEVEVNLILSLWSGVV